MPVTDGHDVGNYRVGKGVLSFQPGGTGDFIDLGNVTSLVISPDLETLEHFSSRVGVRAKDLEVVIEKKGAVQITMEEFNPFNISLALLGSITPAAAGPQIEIFSQTAINGALKWTAANDVGPKTDLVLHNVSFVNAGDFGFVEDEWGNMEVEAQMLVAGAGPNEGKFGYVQVTNYTGEDYEFETP